jgi:succinate dehydrogenase / fumarate reductase membrane anchor subunit
MSEHYETPLRRAHHLGAAHGGTKHFWQERMTALALLPLTTAFIFIVIKFSGAPYEQARLMMIEPWSAGILALFLLVSIWHMKLGMQVIVEDYIHGETLKFLLLIANNFFCALTAFAALFVLLRLSLGL